jgi:glycosyltransferase involved in cell wall biosynthesis
MRIAILQGAFLPVPPSMGGAVEKMWFVLGKEFASKGHEVLHISRKTEALLGSEVIDQVRHVRVKGYDIPKSGMVLKLLDLFYTLRVRKLFADYDVVITNTFWAPILFTKKVRQACLVDVARMPKGQMWFYRGVGSLRANSGPVAVAIRKELPDFYHEKVVVIPNPLPFTPTNEAILANKKPVILYTGRVHPEKGLDLLVEAFAQSNQNYTLKIVGPSDVAAGGGGLSYLESLQRKAGNAPIEFVGPIYDIEALNRFYAEAAIFVYPSVAETGETFGLAPLEAMAWGCVPVVSNLACFQDFITDGKNGLIFDHRATDPIHRLATCIASLQDDVSLRERLATSCLSVRESHSTAHIADLFLQEFEQIQRKNE